jgi:hypothetical protein
MGWADKNFVVHGQIFIFCVSSVNSWCGSYLVPAIALDSGGVIGILVTVCSAFLAPVHYSSWSMGHHAADCLLTVAGSVLVNRSPLLFNGCCKL